MLRSKLAYAICSARPTAPVGTTFQYCNPNFATLGAVIQAVTGQPYESYVRDHIFAPLGMTHSYTDVEEARQHGLAQGHAKLFGFPVPMTQPFRRYALPQGF
jgi:CubicO group peptidase (beta-lactamase class C family)